MAQQTDSPVATFMRWRRKLGRAADWLERTTGGNQPVSKPRVDTSWHDEMVRRANASYRAAAQKRQKNRANGKRRTFRTTKRPRSSR